MDAIDTTSSVVGNVHNILAAGYHGILRYVSPNSGNFPDKQITAAEAAAIHSVPGMMIGLCYEYEPASDIYADQLAYFTVAQANRDTTRVLAALATLGSPATVPVFFATDMDVQTSDLPGPILEYFTTVHATMKSQNPSRLIGVYGSGNTCAFLIEHGVVHYTWLSESTGWGGYDAWKNKADILQLQETTVVGLPVDTNVVNNLAVLW